MSKGVIGFAGLSHLGIVSSIAAASKGFKVLGYDGRTDLCRDLGQGEFPISEPGLAELFKKSRHRIEFTDDHHRLKECELLYYSLDVPTNANNESDLSALKALIQTTLPHLDTQASLVVFCQVHPGFTRALSADIKQRLYYQVETLIFGQAVERAVSPERFIVGCANSAHEIPSLYQDLLQSYQCPILKMRYESAELAKISINFFLAASLSTTNMLAELCEGVGADWSEIAPTLRLDKRIGPHAYLTPGLGIAGGNIERDLITIKRLASQTGAEDAVASSYLLESRYRRDWVIRQVHQSLLSSRPNAILAVWGLAYKPNTHSIKNSPTLALLEALSGVPIRLYDPQAKLTGRFPHVTVVSSPMEACQQADALIIMTAWNEFKSISSSAVREALNESLVIDPWAMWKNKDLGGMKYLTLGVQSDLRGAYVSHS